jgi:hypothetical protein
MGGRTVLVVTSVLTKSELLKAIATVRCGLRVLIPSRDRGEYKAGEQICMSLLDIEEGGDGPAVSESIEESKSP